MITPPDHDEAIVIAPGRPERDRRVKPDPVCSLSGVAALVALLWGAAEGSLFFIVPDVVIGWIALRRGLKAALAAAVLAAVGAALAGAVLWTWATWSPAAALRAVERVPAVSAPMIPAARADIAAHGWFRAALGGPATSTPYKVYAALAPGAGVGLGELMLMTLPARLPRFFVVALAFAGTGAALRRWNLGLAPWAVTLLYAAGWLIFYGWFFASHPN